MSLGKTEELIKKLKSVENRQKQIAASIKGSFKAPKIGNWEL